MACPPESYTVVLIPLRTSLYSLDALRFYLWIKRLKDLEREKDSLWAGIQVLEQARLWYRQRLEDNRTRQVGAKAGPGALAEVWGEEQGTSSCHRRSRIQRVNGSLGSLMSEPNATSSVQHLGDGRSDSGLRWQNTVLVQEVGEKNRQISLLELERQYLLQQLGELQAH